MAYTIEYSLEAEAHLRELTARQRSIVTHAVDVQLAHEPLKPTRNRKQLRSNTFAGWELRARECRVFYDVDEPQKTVVIRAVGIKKGERLDIAGEEVKLQ